jgi:hypothetical protein
MDFITEFNNFINNNLGWILDNKVINLFFLIFIGLYIQYIRPKISSNLTHTCKHPLIIYLLTIYMLYYETNNIILAIIPSTLFIILYFDFFTMIKT